MASEHCPGAPHGRTDEFNTRDAEKLALLTSPRRGLVIIGGIMVVAFLLFSEWSTMHGALSSNLSSRLRTYSLAPYIWEVNEEGEDGTGADYGGGGDFSTRNSSSNAGREGDDDGGDGSDGISEEDAIRSMLLRTPSRPPQPPPNAKWERLSASFAQPPRESFGGRKWYVRERMLVAITSCNNWWLVDRMLTLAPRTPWLDYIIVDDASLDNISAVASKHDVPLLRTAKPRGLTALWNAVYAKFVREGYEFLVISNNDVRIPMGALEAIRDAMRSDPTIHVWGPLSSTRGLGHRRVRVRKGGSETEHYCEWCGAGGGFQRRLRVRSTHVCAVCTCALSEMPRSSDNAAMGTSVRITRSTTDVSQELSSVHAYLPSALLEPYIPISATQLVQDALTVLSASSTVPIATRPKRHLLGFFLGFSRGVIPKALAHLPDGNIIPSTPRFIIIHQVSVCVCACVNRCRSFIYSFRLPLHVYLTDQLSRIFFRHRV